jgi:hypothetical protein
MTLLLDEQPVFTLWSVDRGERRVFIFQSEGGAVTQTAADAYFHVLRTVVAPEKREYVTLYDLSRPLSDFTRFALQLGRNVREIRETLLPVRTVIVCPNATARNVMRIILGIVGGSRPYVIVDTLDKGWSAAFAAARADEQGILDEFDEPLTQGLDAEWLHMCA